jgi:TrmH family RNA methyltransferase
MLSKNKIKYLKSLQLKKYRLQERKFVVEGDKIVRELINSSYVIKSIYATKKWIETHQVLLKPVNEFIFEADTKQLQAATSLTTYSAVIAEVDMPSIESQVLDPSHSLHLYLDGIRDPGNMGTIIRTAAWFGLTQIICSPDCVDVYNNKVLQSSMGSFLHIQILTLDGSELKNKLPNHQLIGATLEGTLLSEFEKPEKMILIIGNEGKGISPKLLHTCDQELTISKGKNSTTESLNAAISTSILLYNLRL